MRRRYETAACRRGTRPLLRTLSACIAASTFFAPFAPAQTGATPLPTDSKIDSRIDAPLRVMMSDPAPPSTAGALQKGRVFVAANDGRLNDGTVQLVIEGDVSRTTLENAGFLVNTQAGPITTVQGHLADVPGLLAIDGIRLISASSAVQPMLDVSAPAVDADVLWGGVPPYFPGVSGRNVVVGIVDSGLDLNHADFRNASNLTRVKYAWDQTWTGTKPAGFNYGAEYTEAMINAGQASAFIDSDGHGTHVTGIAAGNGRATGNSQPNYHYVGIAPEADLVIVKTNFTDAGIIDGVNYIFQRAAWLGRPAVVNLSIGSHKGGHDGTVSLDQAISALTGPGKLVTAAAGNYGQIAMHARSVTAIGQTQAVVFTVPTYTPSQLSPENVFIEGWHDGAATYQVKLRSPHGYESAWITPGNTTGAVTVSDGTYTVDNDLVTNSLGAKLIQVIVYRASTTSPDPAMGNWTISVTRTGGSNSVCDFWISTWKLPTTTSPSFTVPDWHCMVTSPGTAGAVITTGAYATKVQWTNGNGGTSTYGNIPLETIANFSSPGPRRDGVRKPDVVAPGYGVAAALSVNAPTSNSYKVRDLVHYMRIGTSAANAHTTGALALLLQSNATLSPDAARTELIQRAHADQYTGQVPNDFYGYGKLDVAAGASAVTEIVRPQTFHLKGPFPNPSTRATSFQFTLPEPPSGGVSPLVRFGIFDIQGRMIAELEPEPTPGAHSLAWDGLTADGSIAPAGIYFARLLVGTRATDAVRITRVK